MTETKQTPKQSPLLSAVMDPIVALKPNAPIAVSETSTIAEVVATMQEHKIGCVVVVAKNGHLTGIISERDILQKVYLISDADPKTTPVTEFMTHNPKTESMMSPIAFAMQLMNKGGFRHLPVINDNDEPIGLISIRDITHYLVTHIAETELADIQIGSPC